MQNKPTERTVESFVTISANETCGSGNDIHHAQYEGCKFGASARTSTCEPENRVTKNEYYEIDPSRFRQPEISLAFLVRLTRIGIEYQ